MGWGAEQSHCPDIDRTVELLELLLTWALSSSGWTQSKSFVGFCRSPKIFCSSCSGLFTEGKALGRFSSCTRNVRRMMRQSLIVELIQSTANISETPKAGFLLSTTDREADWIIIFVKVYEGHWGKLIAVKYEANHQSLSVWSTRMTIKKQLRITRCWWTSVSSSVEPS